MHEATGDASAASARSARRADRLQGCGSSSSGKNDVALLAQHNKSTFGPRVSARRDDVGDRRLAGDVAQTDEAGGPRRLRSTNMKRGTPYVDERPNVSNI